MEECIRLHPPKKVKVIVEKVPVGPTGPCDCHTEGQVFEFDFERCPGNFCAAAFHAMWPSIRVLELGGRHPWDEEAGVTYACCPDATKPVTFKIIAE